MAEKNQIFKNDWISIYKGFRKVNFRVGPASYFDDRMHFSFSPSLIIPLIGIFFTGLSIWSLIWILFIFFGYGQIYMDLPIRSGIDDSEPPEYGFYFYGEEKVFFTSFWLCLGEKKKCFYMPWDLDWVRTSILLKDETWEHDTYKNRKKKIYKDFYKDEWQNVIWKESYPYTYTLKSGKVQHRIAELKIEEREWRWRALKWFPIIRKKRKIIDVKFSYGGPFKRFVIIEKQGFKIPNSKEETGEVGERTGEWKGGTTGCGYQMLPNETPLETLRRMEKERKFN
jgi:hypothetical protein